MPIMELLLRQKPKRRISERADRQYQALVGYAEEIKEAQRNGYSWHQICEAIQTEMQRKGEWGEDWDFWDAQRVFYARKRRDAA